MFNTNKLDLGFNYEYFCSSTTIFLMPFFFLSFFFLVSQSLYEKQVQDTDLTSGIHGPALHLRCPIMECMTAIKLQTPQLVQADKNNCYSEGLNGCYLIKKMVLVFTLIKSTCLNILLSQEEKQEEPMLRQLTFKCKIKKKKKSSLCLLHTHQSY